MGPSPPGKGKIPIFYIYFFLKASLTSIHCFLFVKLVYIIKKLMLTPCTVSCDDSVII